MTHLPLIPDERITGWLPVIRQQWEAVTEERCGAAISGSALLDAVEEAFFVEFIRQAGADEGCLWLADGKEEVLVGVHALRKIPGTPHARPRLPLSSGILGMVIATQSGVCENWIGDEERTLGDEADSEVAIVHLAAVPLFLCGEARGVISAEKHGKRVCVDDEKNPPEPFGEDVLPKLLLSAHVLGEVVSARFLRNALAM